MHLPMAIVLITVEMVAETAIGTFMALLRPDPAIRTEDRNLANQVTRVGVLLTLARSSEASATGAMCVLVPSRTLPLTISSTPAVVKAPLKPLNKFQSTTYFDHLMGPEHLTFPEESVDNLITSCPHRTPDCHGAIIRASVSARTNRKSQQTSKPLVRTNADDVITTWLDVATANLLIVATNVVTCLGVVSKSGLPQQCLRKPSQMHLLPSST